MAWSVQTDPGPEPLDGRSFLYVLTFASLMAVLVFFWTLSRHEAGEPRPVRPGLAPLRLTWGDEAREMYVQGRFGELAVSAGSQRRNGSRDPQAWLFGALAHERLAGEPGLDSIVHSSMAERIWRGLLELVDPEGAWGGRAGGRSAPAVGWSSQSDYFAGWALLGLGRPMMARERFSRFAHQDGPWPSSPTTAYNRACYYALAGEAEVALEAWRAWREPRRRGDMRWEVTDPDLELIHPDLWESDLAFRVWTIYVAGERGGTIGQNREEVPEPR